MVIAFELGECLRTAAADGQHAGGPGMDNNFGDGAGSGERPEGRPEAERGAAGSGARAGGRPKAKLGAAAGASSGARAGGRPETERGAVGSRADGGDEPCTVRGSGRGGRRGEKPAGSREVAPAHRVGSGRGIGGREHCS